MKCFLTLFALTIYLTGTSQGVPLDTVSRRKPNANANGQYDIVAVINKNRLNSGDSALVELYITGYGKIQQGKILFSTSTSDIFENSYVMHSLGITPSGNLYWGALRHDFDRLPSVLHLSGNLGGRTKEGRLWKMDLFLDNNNDTTNTSILTENGVVHPPITVHLKIKEDARADDYKFNVNLSYFNGSEWASSSASVDMRVNNVIQEYEVLFGILAALAALVAFLPGIQIAWEFLKKQMQSRKAKAVKK